MDTDMKIGRDLREVRENGTLGPVISCHYLRAAMGITPGKLPTSPVPTFVVGDTTVYAMSRDEAESENPASHRPHRMIAVCNYCKRHIPAGRFGQHLKVHNA